MSKLEEKINEYRLEEPILSILKQISKIKIDNTILQELKTYRVFDKQNDIKYVRGPEDFDVILEIFDTIQRMKDRVCDITLTFMSINYDLARFYNIAKNHLWLKSEMMELKNDPQRYVTISKTIPEVEERQEIIKLILESAEVIVRNLNMTYNVAKEQSVAVQQKMYHRSLTDTKIEKVRS